MKKDFSTANVFFRKQKHSTNQIEREITQVSKKPRVLFKRLDKSHKETAQKPIKIRDGSGHRYIVYLKQNRCSKKFLFLCVFDFFNVNARQLLIFNKKHSCQFKKNCASFIISTFTH